MESISRYDRARPVGDREAAEACALDVFGELVGRYPGISDPDVPRAGSPKYCPRRQSSWVMVGRCRSSYVAPCVARRHDTAPDAALTHCSRMQTGRTS
jgi:hypothetical protein